MSSGFDSTGVVVPDALRSPLLEEEATRRFAIRRFSTELPGPRGSSPAVHNEILSVVYADDNDREPWRERRHDTPRPDRDGANADGRPDEPHRPDDPDRRPGTGNSETNETDRRRGVLNDIDQGTPSTDRAQPPPTHDREKDRPDAEDRGDRPTQPPAWRPDLPSGKTPDWDRMRLEYQRRTHSADWESNSEEAQRRRDGNSEEPDALSAEQLAAFHAAAAGESGADEMLIDLDVLAAEMLMETSAADPPSAQHAIAGVMVGEIDPLLLMETVDSAFLALFDVESHSVATEATPAAVTVHVAPLDIVSEEERGVSLAAAVAVLVASRVESRRRELRGRRKQGRFGWLGIAAQLMLTRRFTTPRQPKILLAMRDEVMRDRLSDVLREDGYSVIPVGTLREAVEQIKAPWETFDAAVTDAELDFSAIHLCNKIRERYPKMPVVVCSEANDAADLTQFRRLGARRCLLKPVEPSELLSAINALVW